ncbi:hypothetical protein [Pseudonocardia kujensis]|uniref:hypothetical protein n=1 Tax=Pseudonocardia kujensis TaxID=1128675 RepID=UPI0027DFAFF9|nr:hypothetical protein [Pseudonocardia kujensis]
MVLRSGIHLVKLWFSVSQNEQRTRFLIRRVDPVRQWKLSPTDLASLDRWDDYTEAKEAMFFPTDTADAPWTVIKSNDKKRARPEAIRHVLALFDYPGKDLTVAAPPDPLIVGPAASVFEAGEGRAVFPPLAGHPPRRVGSSRRPPARRRRVRAARSHSSSAALTAVWTNGIRSRITSVTAARAACRRAGEIHLLGTSATFPLLSTTAVRMTTEP